MLETLILKYLTNEISPSELEILRKWLKKSENREVFEHYIQDAYLLNRSNNSIDLGAAYEKVWQKIQHQEKPVRKLFNKKKIYAIAASVVLLISLGTFLYNQKSLISNKSNNQSVVSNTIKIGTDKAILTLEDGSEVALEKDKNYKNKNVSSNGQEIVYDQSAGTEKEILFNYLTIPRGGQYTIKLADGTQVWLNSESKLKFPVAFSDKVSRNVELMYGEAYFDVSPSSKHKGTHFKVFHNKQEIEVIGTEFNIKAYPDESNIYTTLVEGKVALSFGARKENLLPNQQSNLDLNTNKFKISNVDVSRSVAWKEGVFYFEDESIENILKTMSRWYDFEYRFKSETLKSSRFTGLIKKRKNLEDILNIISRTSNIKYSINSKNNVNEVIISSK
ncbi:FecR family protein [Flavobacterium ajazii]|uniref:FecR family protein n=1 Tax=Flavobacterium ajazii TaxID=2692318 RepID=UPI0013D3C4B2|nr:FecR family protein [Flavobacterium ajazii]